jgi:beta-lactamase class A
MRIFLVIFGLLAFAAQPAAAQSTLAAHVQNQLAMVVTSNSSDVGIAAIDLTTGETVSVRGTQRYPMASTMKVAVAAVYLSHVERGERSLDDIIGGRTAASLMRAMIVRSDNPATDLLIRDLGGPRAIQKWLEWHNVEGIRVDRTIAQLLRARRDLYESLDSATPLAFAIFLQRLDRGDFLQSWSRNYLLNLMADTTTGSNRMKARLPRGSVAHKTGTLNGYSSDVGYLTLPNGNRVAIAIFARGGVNRPRAIADAARTVYDGFLSAVGRPYSAAAALGAQQ